MKNKEQNWSNEGSTKIDSQNKKRQHNNRQRCIINTNFQIKYQQNNTMTSIQSQYSLTQYTNFRKLEFQYVRLKDQNQEMRIRMADLEELYGKVVRQLTETQRDRTKLQNQKNANKSNENGEKAAINKLIQQIMSAISGIKNQKFDEFHPNSSDSIVKKLQNLYNSIERLGEQYQRVKQSIRQVIEQSNDKQKQWTQRQQNMSDQIADLQVDLQSLSNLQKELQDENNRILHENEQLRAQIKSYKALAIQARNQRTPVKTLPNQLQSDFNEQDKDFANDLLGYENQLLGRVYELVIESFDKDDVGLCLRKIYQAYGDVCECFREKLQIQYDLTDLECQYQKRKGTVSKEGLVELRKQINNFRKQLFNQKEILHKRQQILQERVKDLSGQTVHDNRLRNFTIGLQTKLRKQKTGTQQNQASSSLRGQFSKMGTGTIQFKHSMKADEIVKQMIRKDRQNVQKMLKQTRHQFRR